MPTCKPFTLFIPDNIDAYSDKDVEWMLGHNLKLEACRKLENELIRNANE